MVRSIEQLRDVDDPAWPLLAAAIRDARERVRVLKVDRKAGERALHRVQVTARSVLGAVVLNCGGLLVDNGWLRILGGGDGLPDLATATATFGGRAGNAM